MRIGLIRHFPVNKEFLKGRVKQSQVIQWFAEYDEAAVKPLKVATGISWHKCYSSKLPRAVKTAEAIFQGEIETSELLNEPGVFPIFRRDVQLPFLVWGMLLRWAILSNHQSQQHRKEVIEARIRKFLDKLLSEEDADILIVSHAFTMEILSKLLLSCGFTGKRLSRPKNGVLYIYERGTTDM